MKFTLTLFVALLMSVSLSAQKKIKVLFIGNSYTSVNNLPQAVHDVALSNGDTLIFDSSTPGGYTFNQQSTYAPTLTKIAQGGWDYVVLQAQSQEPSFDPSQVATDTYPYAARLDSLVHAVDSCTETVFYMTWGKKNGDASNCAAYPPICTYTGCQDRLSQSYLEMGQMNHATVSPAGEAWRRIIGEHHSFDLYQADESHPTIFGTYLTASVFYEVLFQKTVLNTSFVTAGIPDSNARQLRQAAHSIVFDTLSKWFGNGHVPIASFAYSARAGGAVAVQSTSINGNTFSWDFGDGSHPMQVPTDTHVYVDWHIPHHVTLTVSNNCKTSVYTRLVMFPNDIFPNAVEDLQYKFAFIYPDPASTIVNIDMDAKQASNGCTISLVNAMGQTIQRQISNNSSSNINVSELAEGLYVVVISTAAGEYHYPVSVLR